MFSVRRYWHGGFARQCMQRRLLATGRPLQKSRLVKPVLAFAGVSSIAAYFLLPDESRHAPTHKSRPLNPSHFTPATLVDSVPTSADTKLLTLSVPPELLPHNDMEAFVPIWSVFIKDDDIQVERPYTPLEGVDENGRMKFWIKKYEHGEVGRWLHSKQAGDSIEMRGPVKTWSRSWKDNDWDEIIMISGGTGITPFYQLLHGLFNTNDTPFNGRLTLLHGSRTSADLPPPLMMNHLTTLAQQKPSQFKLRLFVDSSTGSAADQSLPIERGRIGKGAIQDALHLTQSTSWWGRFFKPSTTPFTAERKVLVMICGPEPMVTAIAGAYGRNYSQGKVGGVLGELGLQSHQVWKL
ncbi:hypothetical protein HYDPIDRAFT_105040, partial [Hydnomerulius pinastri MD-312]